MRPPKLNLAQGEADPLRAVARRDPCHGWEHSAGAEHRSLLQAHGLSRSVRHCPGEAGLCPGENAAFGRVRTFRRRGFAPP